jgi:hypothetical protein
VWRVLSFFFPLVCHAVRFLETYENEMSGTIPSDLTTLTLLSYVVACHQCPCVSLSSLSFVGPGGRELFSNKILTVKPCTLHVVCVSYMTCELSAFQSSTLQRALGCQQPVFWNHTCGHLSLNTTCVRTHGATSDSCCLRWSNVTHRLFSMAHRSSMTLHRFCVQPAVGAHQPTQWTHPHWSVCPDQTHV